MSLFGMCYKVGHLFCNVWWGMYIHTAFGYLLGMLWRHQNKHTKITYGPERNPLKILIYIITHPNGSPFSLCSLQCENVGQEWFFLFSLLECGVRAKHFHQLPLAPPKTFPGQCLLHFSFLTHRMSGLISCGSHISFLYQRAFSLLLLLEA